MERESKEMDVGSFSKPKQRSNSRYDASIVLCTVNEIENLPKLVKQIDEIVKFSFQYVFVDDGSTDGTREFIEDYTRMHSNAKFIFNPFLSSTLIAEYRGMKNSEGRYLIKLDADLQHPPEIINEIYKKLSQGYEIVVASRFVRDGPRAKRNPARGLVSRVAESLAKSFLKGARRTSDPLSGYFGVNSKLKLEINEKWRGFKMLLFILSFNPKARTIDVPYRFQERVNGKSKIANGLDFIRIYLTELILAKKIEMNGH